jgi:hypothetical protein
MQLEFLDKITYKGKKATFIKYGAIQDPASGSYDNCSLIHFDDPNSGWQMYTAGPNEIQGSKESRNRLAAAGFSAGLWHASTNLIEKEGGSYVQECEVQY